LPAGSMLVAVSDGGGATAGGSGAGGMSDDGSNSVRDTLVRHSIVFGQSAASATLCIC
jgi:hypothetical protein